MALYGVAPSSAFAAAFDINENTTAVGTVTAVLNGVITFSITGGADAVLLSINTATGALSFFTAPDFENPQDLGGIPGDNVYEVEVTASGDDGGGPGSGGVDVQSVVITVHPVNDNTPVFQPPFEFTVFEFTVVAGTVTATDADLPGDILTYSIPTGPAGGPDRALFNINPSTGVLSFISPPEFDNPLDAGADNVYDLNVRVQDRPALAFQHAYTVTVESIGNNGPVIISGDAFDVDENTTAVTTVSAIGGGVVTYSVSGGADGALFTIDGVTGALSFVAAPDFEDPQDTGGIPGDNVYEVEVTASGDNGGGPGSAGFYVQTINVTVIDVDPTTITSANAFNVNENTTAVTTVTAVSEGVVAFSISGGADQGSFTINTSTGALSFKGPPDFENPLDVGANNVYAVEVTASGDDGGGPGSAGVDAQTINVTVAPLNDNTPVFKPPFAFSVEEQTTVVGTVMATDADLPGDVLTYSIPGGPAGGPDRALFSINASTGVLSFIAPPDFDNPLDVGADNVYNVNVRVQDRPTLAFQQAYTVTVEPVITLPEIVDIDMDGLPDSWETANDVTDPGGDPDLDGATNIEEYKAGTDPQDELSTPEGGDGVNYVLLRDHFDDSQYDERWYLTFLDPGTSYTLLEAGTDLQMTIDRPAAACDRLQMDSFSTVDAADTVYHTVLQLDGRGVTTVGLMRDRDPDNHIEVVFDNDTDPYLVIRSVDTGVLTEFPVSLPGPLRGAQPVDVRMTKAGDQYTVYVDYVHRASITNNGLGDLALRPYIAAESCATDTGPLDSNIDIIEVLTDTDGDGRADTHEDANANGVVDGGESDPLDPDTDDDTVLDGHDNCVLVDNGDQRDTNTDGFGNVCDGDLDNDGVVSTPDLVIFRNVLFTTDSEDADFDGDGVVSTPDLVRFRQMLFGEPGPSGLVP